MAAWITAQDPTVRYVPLPVSRPNPPNPTHPPAANALELPNSQHMHRLPRMAHPLPTPNDPLMHRHRVHQHRIRSSTPVHQAHGPTRAQRGVRPRPFGKRVPIPGTDESPEPWGKSRAVADRDADDV